MNTCCPHGKINHNPLLVGGVALSLSLINRSHGGTFFLQNKSKEIRNIDTILRIHLPNIVTLIRFGLEGHLLVRIGRDQ